ncbi:MAG: serine hydrolase [Pirellulaceae bacterium]|nr:serine hydrolase [Pirellulaceae bacterium]
MRSFCCFVGVCLSALSVIHLLAPNSLAQAPKQFTQALDAAIQPLLKDYKGDVAVAVYHFESNTLWSKRGEVPMPTASLIKLPVMIEAYRQVEAGKVSLDERIELRKEDMVQGSGILTTHFSPGTTLSLRDAIRLMIVYSDNTATNLVVDAIGLPATTKTMNALGFPETQLHAKVFRGDTSIAPERSKKYGLGSTTALDMVNLLIRLKKGELANPKSTEAMLDHLLNCDDKTRFTLLLPSGVKVAHKTGSVTRVRTDAGLIMGKDCTLALSVLTDNNTDTRWTDDNAGNRLCAEIAKATYDIFAQKNQPAPSGVASVEAHAATSAEMKIGATGELVEALQRTLNARMEPPANLSVDGDFGPATEAAVKAFQRQKQIAVSGIVDAATWNQLGTLIDAEAPVAEPSVVNSEKLELKPADEPLGPPQVSCEAWVIVDRANGQVLAGTKADQRTHIASTTKIMTAYLVLKMAKEQPEILYEVITFSQRADDTVGSTAGVKAGEQLTVGELLYGLMLPSGNDASVAFAEHFGRKFAGDPTLADDKSYEHFVARMNSTAAELGMNQTHYINPHGLTHEDHLSTASDLARLARAALDLPRFRDYVTCRQHGCVVSVPNGYKRNLKWENTNRLLGIEGYAGIKTGTTDAAGACLVSSSQRNGRELIVVSLKSANTDARYIDARNLHAFGWRTATAE